MYRSEFELTSGYDEFSIPYGAFDNSFLEKPDPYIAIQNEPMGRNYTPADFDSSIDPRKIYNYNALTFRTPSTSYFDSWNPITGPGISPGVKSENLSNPGIPVPAANYLAQQSGIRSKQAPFIQAPAPKHEFPELFTTGSFGQDMNVFLLILLFVFVILFSYFQQRQIDKLYTIIETGIRKTV